VARRQRTPGGKERTVKLNSYLNFDGQCEEAFRFYERCLRGKIVSMMNHEESPIADQVPAAWGKRIMHARLQVGEGILLGSDFPPDEHEKPRGFAVALQLKDPGEADRVFRELAEDGTIQLPIQPTFWAVRFGMLVDRFGIPWMVNCEPTD
jgi:PhnB protein